MAAGGDPHGGVAIPLSRGKVAWVDAADAPRVQRYLWSYLPPRGKRRGTGYAVRMETRADGTRHLIQLHRFLLRASRGVSIDHVDNDGLNCRRSNLRVATRSQNGLNEGLDARSSSGWLGVVRWKDGWRGQVVKDGRRYRTGVMGSASEAARERDALAWGLYGEFARLNFPEERMER
jgi:hypothetical protein